MSTDAIQGGAASGLDERLVDLMDAAQNVGEVLASGASVTRSEWEALDHTRQQVTDAFRALASENERLRDALTVIACYAERTPRAYFGGMDSPWVSRTARAALAPAGKHPPTPGGAA